MLSVWCIFLAPVRNTTYRKCARIVYVRPLSHRTPSIGVPSMSSHFWLRQAGPVSAGPCTRLNMIVVEIKYCFRRGRPTTRRPIYCLSSAVKEKRSCRTPQ